MSDFLAEAAINAADRAAAEKTGAPDIMAFERIGGARYYHDLPQGSDEWLKMRLGLITGSEVGKILTPTLKTANNAETRKHVFDLVAQRITRHIDPHYMSWDMERGHLEEVDARIVYEKHYAPVQTCGFIVNDSLGFDVGFSPDGLVGDLGMIETKSRMAKYQVQTILEHINVADAKTEIPIEFMLQVQTGLWVTDREYCDFNSFSNGVNMATIRCQPIPEYQDAIKAALIATECKINELHQQYNETINAPDARIHPVARTDYSEEMDL